MIGKAIEYLFLDTSLEAKVFSRLFWGAIAAGVWYAAQCYLRRIQPK